MENGYSIRIANVDSLALVIVRLAYEQSVEVNHCYFQQGRWKGFTSGIDSLFWDQNFRSKTAAAIQDGAGYTFEGLDDGEYKLIKRGSIGVRENQLLLERFHSFMPEFPFQICKNSK